MAGFAGPNPHGAGSYGRVHGRDTVCRHANNPYGHNPECACGWKNRARASQIVPYAESADWSHYPRPDYPESPYGAL